MKKILFVDDEPKVLDGLRRMLHPLRGEWHMTFVGSGCEALRALSETKYDLLITDIRMPEMSGIDLLSEVVKHYPEVTRIVLSGTADQEASLRTVKLAHQYLLKPCDAKTLRATVERAFNLQVALESPALKTVISGTHTLPSVPAVYVRLMGALQSPNTSPRQVGEIIGQDVGMTSKVLQLVNSAFFGVGRRILNPVDAVIYLGIETVRDLALMVSVFSQFENTRTSRFSLVALQDHSLAVGGLARKVTHSARWPRAVSDEALVGGFLHDVGKLVIGANYPKQYELMLRQVREEAVPVRQVEFDTFGTTHAEIGAYLFWLWNLPDPLIEVTALHHNPPATCDSSARAVTAVHMADVLINHGSVADIHPNCQELQNDGSLDWNCLQELLLEHQNAETHSVR